MTVLDHRLEVLVLLYAAVPDVSGLQPVGHMLRDTCATNNRFRSSSPNETVKRRTVMEEPEIGDRGRGIATVDARTVT
jgi:hypothetical protein